MIPTDPSAPIRLFARPPCERSHKLMIPTDPSAPIRLFARPRCERSHKLA